MTAPNTALSWAAGSARTVTWTHNYGLGQRFDIAFSPTAGATWIPVATDVAAATATTGTYTGPLPAVVTPQALIRVSPTGNVGDGDVSNVTFATPAPTITVTAPNTNVPWTVGSQRSASWSHNLGGPSCGNIDVSRDGGATWVPIITNRLNSTLTTQQLQLGCYWSADACGTDSRDLERGRRCPGQQRCEFRDSVGQ